MDDEKIENIQKQLKQLSQKQLELSKSHQQQFLLYRWLQGPDPELQAVKEEIAHFKTREVEYLKILQAKASIPPHLFILIPKVVEFRLPGGPNRALCNYFDCLWHCFKSPLEVLEHREGSGNVGKGCGIRDAIVSSPFLWPE